MAKASLYKHKVKNYKYILIYNATYFFTFKSQFLYIFQKFPENNVAHLPLNMHPVHLEQC